MLMDQVEEFSEFLGVTEDNLDDVLKFLAIYSFAPLGCTGIFISALNSDGSTELIGNFVLDKNLLGHFPTLISLNGDNPVAQAIKGRKLVWTDGFSEIASTEESKSLICAPIELNHAPVAVMGIYSNFDLDPTEEISAFIKAIIKIFAIFFYQLNGNAKAAHKESQIRSVARSAFEGNQLSDRQSQILHLMAEGKTNLAIAETLGFSESTIRQETIRIYSKLRCSGRKEATLIFNEMSKKTSVAV